MATNAELLDLYKDLRADWHQLARALRSHSTNRHDIREECMRLLAIHIDRLPRLTGLENHPSTKPPLYKADPTW